MKKPESPRGLTMREKLINKMDAELAVLLEEFEREPTAERYEKAMKAIHELRPLLFGNSHPEGN